MAVFNERRKHNRYDHLKSRVVVKKKPEDPSINALIVNYSEGGMYLKTEEPIKVGQHVTVQMEDSEKSASGPEKYDSLSGWVRRVGNHHKASNGFRHQYAIEYDRPVSLFE